MTQNNIHTPKKGVEESLEVTDKKDSGRSKSCSSVASKPSNSMKIWTRIEIEDNFSHDDEFILLSDHEKKIEALQQQLKTEQKAKNKLINTLEKINENENLIWFGGYIHIKELIQQAREAIKNEGTQ